MGIVASVLAITPSVCSAETPLHKVESAVPMDKWVHGFGGYFVNSELKRNTKLTTLERLAVVGAIAYAKEQWVDDTFDKNDIIATMVGALTYEIKF